jgi:hypothetical protein
VYFRRRIGGEGVTLIMGISANMHGEKARETEVVIDTTAQEKNITYPTDTKLYRKIIGRCWKMADRNAVKLRRRYGKEVRRCLMAQRWRKDPRKRKTARKGQRKLRIIAGRPLKAIVDRGYRGRKQVGGTEVLVPGKATPGQSKSLTTKMRQRFRRRAAIEPLISHLKHDYRLLRCFLKGFQGDNINLMLAAAAWNFRKWMREYASFWLRLFRALLTPIALPLSSPC